MSNVIQFDKPKHGDEVFLMCPCKPEDPVPLMVVALHEPSNKPIICALVCPECDNQVLVVDGIPQAPV